MYFSVRRFGNLLGNLSLLLFCFPKFNQPLQSGDPAKRARAIVQAVRIFQLVSFHSLIANKVTHYNNPKIIAEVSEGLGEAMVGLTMYGRSSIRPTHFYSLAELWTVTRALRVAVWLSVEIKYINTYRTKYHRDLRSLLTGVCEPHNRSHLLMYDVTLLLLTKVLRKRPHTRPQNGRDIVGTPA